MSEQYAALIVDLRDSRKLSASARQDAQGELARGIARANALFATSIEKPLMFSAGDEAQGLFRDAPSAFLAFRLISIFMISARIRGGIGVGGWETRMDVELSTEQDGTAFHRARAAIADVKKDKLSYLRVRGADGVLWSTAVASDLCLNLSESWNQRQRVLGQAVEALLPFVYTASAMPSGVEDVDVASWPVECLTCSDGSAEKLGQYRAMGVGGNVEISVEAIDLGMRGISYKLAEMLGRSRQGIDRSLSNSNIQLERRAAAFTVSTLAREAGQ